MTQRRRPRLSLDLLRGFQLAARHLSFTRAAEELCITQSAISHEVKALEAQLGRPLFRRVNRTLQLTPAGQELYRATNAALTPLEEEIQRIAGSRESLTVTTTSGLASLWLAPRLPGFNRDHPGIDVRVVVSNDRPDLERDQLDLAIRFVGVGADPPEAEPLLDCRSFPVCSPALARDRAHPIRAPGDLARHVRLDYETLRDGRRLSEWDFWFDAMRIARVKPASSLQFPQYDHVVSAAIEGSGVAIGVLPHVARYLRTGALCIPFGRASIVARGTFYVVKRPGVADRDAVEAFVAWLSAEVQGEPQFDPGRGIVRRPTARARGCR